MEIQSFWVPSGMNLIPRYALLHLASLGFRYWLRSVSISSPQGPQKMNFLPRKMDPPVFVTYWLTNTHFCSLEKVWSIAQDVQKLKDFPLDG